MRRSELPPALPPETRPVGQLVAETLRFYGDAFWAVLPIGIPLALTNQLTATRSHWTQVAILEAALPLIAAAFVSACLIVAHERPSRATIAQAFVLAVAILLPVPLLMLYYVLPAVAWLALVGLAVPAALLEGRPLRGAVARGVELARADYVHALGSLATLAILFGVTKIMLILLLRGQAETTERLALLLADLVLSPVLFVGGALLYFDQAARLAPRRQVEANRRRL